MELTKLNEQQKEAILYDKGPLLIFAGAGSGKTRVLTYKVAYLIEEKEVSPFSILAITFTNKAAKEMKERIFSLIGSKARDIQISTFHSFGFKIIRENYKDLGLNNNFTILDENDGTTIIKKILKNLNLDPKHYNPGAIKNQISGAKNTLLTPDLYRKYIKTEWDEIVYKVFHKYQDTLVKNNSVDFDDLLMLPIILFREHPDILDRYQERYKYILIDEYQDTNEAQYTLSKMISAKYKNICVVGDNDQCLIEGSLIETKKGLKKIETLNKKDIVLSGGGFGGTIYTKLTSIIKKKYKGKIIKIQTKKGYELSATPNHIIFSNLEVDFNKYYIYLMYKKGLGYRIGQTSSLRHMNNKIVNGLIGRLNGEHGDKIWIIKVCSSKEEATYYEELISTQYGLPKVVFHVRGRRISLSQNQIDKLFNEIDTVERAQKLMNDYGLYFNYPHHYAQGTLNGTRARKYININFFGGKYNQTRNMYTHRIGINNGDDKNKIELQNLGFPVRNGKLKTWRIETERATIENIEIYAQMIKSLTDDYEIIKKAHLTKENSYHFMPMGSLREGMTLIIKNNDVLIEDTIVNIDFLNYDGYVYDINVENTHNYIANNILVHNCIYSFRGADYNNIINFEKDYPEAKVILLEENYRSTKTILNAANNVIKNNKLRKEKNLWTQNEEGYKIKYYRAYDEMDEASYVVKEIKKLHQEGIPYDQMAILYRTNAQSRIVEEGFLVENIPYKVVGAYAFYNRKEIKDLVAYLKLIYNDKDDLSLLRCINTPKRGIGNKTIENLMDTAEKEHKSIYEIISSGKELQFKELIEELKNLSENSSLTELVDLVLNKSGMKQELEKEHSLEADIRLENLEEFKSITRSFEEKYGVISLEDFLVEISLVSNSDDTKEEVDKVSLLTTHSVKGLEFEIVFIVGLEEGILPHSNAFLGNNEIEEERRLFYVAVTRAKKILYFINARMRMLFGDRRINPESRFINEVGYEHIEANEKEKIKVQQEDRVYDGDVSYTIGEYIIHDTFGEGIVIALDKSVITIAFSHPHGIKKMIKNHKSIRKK